MRQAQVELGREPAWQWPAQADQEHANVAEGDVAAQLPSGLAGGEHAQHGSDGGLARAPELFVLKGDGPQQRGHDGRDAQVERAVHVAREGGPGVGCLDLGAAGDLGGAGQDVECDGALEAGAVGEAAIKGGNADAGAAGNLVEGRVGAMLDEDVAGGGEELLTVAAGIGAETAAAAGPGDSEDVEEILPLRSSTR